MTLVVKRIVGTIFLLVGVAGVFLPLMPGVIFIILGSALLGSNNRLVVKVKGMVRQRLDRDKSQPPQTNKSP
jgi:uncharacterized membrane protein YbaN (DUF454 family)